jgi:hypothetical protein
MKTIKQEKLKPGAGSPGAKQYGDQQTNGQTNQWTNGTTNKWTNGPTDQRTNEPTVQRTAKESYGGSMLAPKNKVNSSA